MKEIIIKTQEELDKLPEKFKTFTRIIIKNDASKYIHVNKTWDNAHVEAWDNAHVEARDNAHVEASGKAHVEAWGNAHVEARDNAHVEARDNAHVVARGKAHVVASGNAHVEAWDNAHVEASGKAHVVASGNAHVVARGNVSVYAQSERVTIALFMFAVCWLIRNAIVKNKSKTAMVIQPFLQEGMDGWLDSQGLKKTRAGYVTLYKRVSSDFKTQEGTNNETLWEVGSTLEHSSWDPKKSECGEGKFHSCSRPFLCDQFRYKKFDKYVAIKVNIKDMYVWPKDPKFPTKVAFRKGRVLYECDRFGNQIKE